LEDKVAVRYDPQQLTKARIFELVRSAGFSVADEATAAPAVVAHGTGVRGTFAHGVLAEEVDLELVIIEARFLRDIFEFLGFLTRGHHGLARESTGSEQAESARE
jgi:hypothetical protein